MLTKLQNGYKKTSKKLTGMRIKIDLWTDGKTKCRDYITTAIITRCIKYPKIFHYNNIFAESKVTI